MKRTQMKRRQPKRQWDRAIEKVESEGCCRVCGASDFVDAAHTIGRAKQDKEVEGPRGGTYLYVDPDSIIPLCSEHHRMYDSHRLDLLPYMKLPEQVNAVQAAGGIALANRRLSGNA
jgi:hypothetical protein